MRINEYKKLEQALRSGEYNEYAKPLKDFGIHPEKSKFDRYDLASKVNSLITAVEEFSNETLTSRKILEQTNGLWKKGKMAGIGIEAAQLDISDLSKIHLSEQQVTPALVILGIYSELNKVGTKITIYGSNVSKIKSKKELPVETRGVNQECSTKISENAQSYP